METFHQLWDLFPYAVMGSVIAGIICAFLGNFVISQKVVFLGAVLTQVSIAGVAFSFLHFVNLESILSVFVGNQMDKQFIHNFEPLFFSLLFAIICVLIFSQTFTQKYLTQDGILGIIFVTAISARIMFIQKSPVAEVSEIESILKGDILFIGKPEFYILLVVMLVIVSVFIIFQKQLKFVTFNPETAIAHGINSKLWLLVFYLIVGMGISITTRFVGDVFAFAFLIIPPSIGILLGKKIISVFLIATLVGAFIPPVSLYFAFKLDFSSGPTAVILAFGLFLVTYFIKKIRA